MLETGCHITYYRLEKGLTQAELARRCGIPQPNLSNIEKGKRDLTVSTLRRISYALGVPAARLVEAVPAGASRAKAPLTRDFMEEVARRIVTPEKTAAGGSRAEEIAGLFRKILPSRGGKKNAGREINLAWIKLRKQLTSGEIRSLYERIEDARQRKP